MSAADWFVITVGYVVLVGIILRGFHVIGRIQRELGRRAGDRRG
jgi:hypothetical protein